MTFNFYLLGGGRKQIENRKVEWNAGSKVGSKNNIKHKPGGGNVQVQGVQEKCFFSQSTATNPSPT